MSQQGIKAGTMRQASREHVGSTSYAKRMEKIRKGGLIFPDKSHHRNQGPHPFKDHEGPVMDEPGGAAGEAGAEDVHQEKQLSLLGNEGKNVQEISRQDEAYADDAGNVSNAHNCAMLSMSL